MPTVRTTWTRGPTLAAYPGRVAAERGRADRPWLLIEVHAVENCLALARMSAEWGHLFTIVRYPGYETCSPLWHTHGWFGCQPAKGVDRPE